jgi:hypothetical protein
VSGHFETATVGTHQLLEPTVNNSNHSFSTPLVPSSLLILLPEIQMGNNESNVVEESIPVKSEAPKAPTIVLTGEDEDFRVFVRQNSTEHLSLWHDIKLFPEADSKSKKVVNMVCEIPKCSRKKFEVATKEPGLNRA